MKILIVDDSKTMRIIIKRALTKADIDDLEVVEASSGEDALELLKDTDVDLVICDTSMPGLGSVKTVLAIREEKDKEVLPIIMATSMADKHNILEALKAGANDYMVKPVRQEDIDTKVRCLKRGKYEGKRVSKRKYKK